MKKQIQQNMFDQTGKVRVNRPYVVSLRLTKAQLDYVVNISQTQYSGVLKPGQVVAILFNEAVTNRTTKPTTKIQI